jgi:two-component system phosphate regulon response regulator PhoB
MKSPIFSTIPNDRGKTQMTKERVLLVEDARDMQLIVQAALADLCDLTCVSTIEDARNALEGPAFSLLILDVNLPDGDGFDFCAAVRSSDTHQALPIMFLTGEGSVDQRVLGFSMGADDYVTKPLEPNEFTARVKSKLKRQQSQQAVLSAPPLRVDLGIQRAYTMASGAEEALSLTPIEFKLLVKFVQRQNVILSREELMVTVWGPGVHISAHTVDTHISSLRKKMGDCGRQLKAVVKRGYCFSSKTKLERNVA